MRLLRRAPKLRALKLNMPNILYVNSSTCEQAIDRARRNPVAKNASTNPLASNSGTHRESMPWEPLTFDFCNIANTILLGKCESVRTVALHVPSVARPLRVTQPDAATHHRPLTAVRPTAAATVELHAIRHKNVSAAPSRVRCRPE